ncbi:minichromosome maintenance subunit [Aureococcus anophagefferens]|uniref:DNA replication licensing factor MCM6 n=1 Tax=Aureococcus anophagefferens TaxID=44056 RepID=A0ABR1GC91_AURAN
MAEVTEQETNNQVVERFCRFLLDFSPGASPEDADDDGGGCGGGKRPTLASQLEGMVAAEEGATVRVDFAELEQHDSELALAIESEFYRFEVSRARRRARVRAARSTAADDVEQQLRYTTPTICRNPQCNNASAAAWQLQMERSRADWQRVRLQEAPDEIPAGSLPRSMDVLVRDEMVEQVKAGDKIVATGAWPSCPTRAVWRAGEATVSSRTGQDGMAQGVTGTKQAGSREMTYRLLFMGSSIERSGDAGRRRGALREGEEDEALRALETAGASRTTRTAS